MELVTIRHRGHDGKTTETQETGGGVFRSLPEKGLREPIWLYGPKKDRFMFSCPVSSIGQDLIDLYSLWFACDVMHTLPCAGGLLDQPAIVQRAFPYFSDEARLVT